VNILTFKVFLYINGFEQKALNDFRLFYAKKDTKVVIHKRTDLIEVINKNAIVRSVFYTKPEHAMDRIHLIWRSNDLWGI